MKTDYQNIKTFDVAVVGMITAGFIIIGVLVFSSLTPRQQVAWSQSVEILDIHQEFGQTVAETKTVSEFVYNIPQEFYNQFYIAFTQVATLPEEVIDTPISVGQELLRNVKVAFNNLSDQVAVGYTAQNNLLAQKSELAVLPYDGKVMGAMIEVSDKLSTIAVTDTSPHGTLNMHYDYAVPSLPEVIKRSE
ncbi:MAG: hypothetical protein KW802_01175 [Candidatus Doudnabacteria bacterium]|nr:hypothetical protein [Candidatus Doudnabacteria bacterium]